MNAIIGMTIIARESKDPERIKSCLEQIESSSRQLLDIINDVLDMSKIEADKMEICQAPFDFNNMIRKVSAVVQVKLDEKRQHFDIDTQGDFSREALGDELRISQILINLLGNAVKFTPEGGHISLKIALKPGNGGTDLLHIEVIDSGIGITRENQAKLFRPFEQAEESTAKNYGGTGLGLSICKSIIDLMGGAIWVESEFGKGANFIFEIPFRWGRYLESGKTEMPWYEAPPSEQHWENKTILAAEDIEINRDIISGLLENSKITIDFANNGVQAVKLFEAAPDKYDLILMDIQMPQMDGYEATRRIRALEKKLPDKKDTGFPRRRIPIIAMTANAFKEDAEHCLKAGMDGHLSKPIELEHFFQSLAKFLN
jgi:CheY-like chemotaxis protein